jgi:hypothetical protein
LGSRPRQVYANLRMLGSRRGASKKRPGDNAPGFVV